MAWNGRGRDGRREERREGGNKMKWGFGSREFKKERNI